MAGSSGRCPFGQFAKSTRERTTSLAEKKMPKRKFPEETLRRQKQISQGYSYEWNVLIKHNKNISCKSDNFVPCVVFGVLLLGGRGQSSASDRVQTDESINRQHDVLEWLQPFTEGMMEDDTKPSGSDKRCHAEPRFSTPPLPPRPSNTPGGKYNLFTQFPKDLICEICHFLVQHMFWGKSQRVIGF